MVHHIMRRAMAVVLVGLALSVDASAQSTTGNLAGTVRDGAGHGVAASITVTSVTNGRSRTIETQDDGTYRIAQLAPGAYALEVRAEGFEPRRLASVQVVIGRTIEIPITLSASMTRPVARAKAWVDVRPETAIDVVLVAGPPKSFGVTLAAGEVADVVFESPSPFVVRAFDPANMRLAWADRPAGNGRSRVFLLANAAGLYRLDVHAVGARDQRTACRISVAAIRRAVPRDEAVAVALRKQWWAAQQEAQRTDASLALALNEYEAAAKLWSELKDADGEAFARARAAIVRESLQRQTP